jgi:hypothetical protein
LRAVVIQFTDGQDFHSFPSGHENLTGKRSLTQRADIGKATSLKIAYAWRNRCDACRERRGVAEAAWFPDVSLSAIIQYIGYWADSVAVQYRAVNRFD